MRTHEIIALGVLLLAFAGGIFALVEVNFREGRPATPNLPVDWDAVIDDPDEHLTISWLGSRGYVSAREGTWIERKIEEQFNIEIKPIFTDGTSYARRRPLLVLSGATPDVLYSPDPHFVQKDVSHGFLLEIPYDVVLKHAPTHVGHVNENGPEAWLYAYSRRGNYGIPTYFVGPKLPSPGVWRMDWLRNVGISKVPETLDEMHEAFWRFRHQDPDGNGIKDTYGESPLRNWSRLLEKIFGAYHILPFSWMVHEGEVTWGGILPRNMEVLALLRKWYSEELFDPDFMSRQQSFPLTAAVFQSGRVGYINYTGYYAEMLNVNGSFAYQTYQLQPEAELVPGNVMTGPNGSGVTRIWGGGGHSLTFGLQVAERPQIVLRVLRMLETWATDESVHLESKFGKRGEHWDYNDELGIHALPKYAAHRQRYLIASSLEDAGASFIHVGGASPELVGKWLTPGGREYRKRYQNPDYGKLDIFGKPGVLPSAGLYLEKLQDLQISFFLGVMRGDRDVEEFDDFVTEWRDSGGDVLLTEAQEVYRAKQEIYRRVGVIQERMPAPLL